MSVSADGQQQQLQHMDSKDDTMKACLRYKWLYCGTV